MSTLQGSTGTMTDSRHPSPPTAGESLSRSQREIYEIWANGALIEAEIWYFDDAILKAGKRSAGYQKVMFGVFYAGTYTEGPNKPKPLAAFLEGERIPVPARVTTPGYYDTNPVAGETGIEAMVVSPRHLPGAG